MPHYQEWCGTCRAHFNGYAQRHVSCAECNKRLSSLFLTSENEIEEKCIEVLRVKAELSVAKVQMNRIQDFLRAILKDAETKGDIVFEVDGERISAHTCILANRSEVFRSMFTHSFEEKISGFIKLQNINVSALRAFLKFLYSWDLDEKEIQENWQMLLPFAHLYAVKDLVYVLDEELITLLDSDNVLLMLQEAVKYNMKRLEAAAEEYLKNNMHIIKVVGTTSPVFSVFHEI